MSEKLNVLDNGQWELLEKGDTDDEWKKQQQLKTARQLNEALGDNKTVTVKPTPDKNDIKARILRNREAIRASGTPSKMKAAYKDAEIKQIQDYTGENPLDDVHQFKTINLLTKPKIDAKDSKRWQVDPSHSEHAITLAGNPVGFAQVKHTDDKDPWIALDLSAGAHKNASAKDREPVEAKIRSELMAHLKSKDFKNEVAHHAQQQKITHENSQEEQQKVAQLKAAGAKASGAQDKNEFISSVPATEPNAAAATNAVGGPVDPQYARKDTGIVSSAAAAPPRSPSQPGLPQQNSKQKRLLALKTLRARYTKPEELFAIDAAIEEERARPDDIFTMDLNEPAPTK